MWLRLRSKLPTWKKMLSSGLEENWHPAPPCSSWVKPKPGTDQIKSSLFNILMKSFRSSFTILAYRLWVNCPHLWCRCCQSTCGSHCADGKRRRENLLGRGRHRPSAPSCRSLRNGSSSESCLGTLGNERGCRGAGRRKRREK